MKCSNCSREIRPIVAVDIDGTLGNYHMHFFNFAKAYFGSKVSPIQSVGYTGNTRYYNWFCKTFEVSHFEFRECKLAYRQGGLKRSMPVYLNASDFTKLLRSIGFEIWITTTRPYMRLDNIDPDTRFWLDHNKIDYDYMIYDDKKYRILAKQVDPKRVLAVVDDLAEEVEEANRFFPETGILRQTLYNKSNWKRFPEDNNLMKIADIIIDSRLPQWRKEHA